MRYHTNSDCCSILRGIPRLTIAILIACHVLSPACAQTEFSDPSGNFKFVLPKDWKATPSGTSIKLTASDGSVFTLSHDSGVSISGGNPSNNPSARTAAERMASPLLSSLSYAGVRQVTVDAGSGASYRFRGKGSKSDYDLVEVWIASIGQHTVVTVPEKAGQPDHAFEIGALFKTLSFSDAPARVPATGNQRGKAKAAAVNKSNSANASPTTIPSPPQGNRHRGINSTRTTEPAATEMERYEGKLKPTDISFVLHVNHNGTASAEYTPTIGSTIKYSGDFKGEDGNYLVNLTRTGTGTEGDKALALTMRALGGMETGTYSTRTSAAQRQVAELRLVGADTGAAGKSAKMNRNRRNRNLQRRNRPGGRPPGFRS